MGNYFEYYLDLEEDRKNVTLRGEKKGKELAADHHPYLIVRNVTEVMAKARSMGSEDAEGENHTNDKKKYTDLFTNGFIKGYLEKVAELDKKAGIIIPTALNPTGATITVTSVDRSNPNENVYYVELFDPEYIDGVFQPEPLTVVFEPEAPTASSSSSFSGQVSSSSDTIRASAGSDATSSRTPQRGRKPIKSQWGKQ
jgi:hypothetical protein